MPIGPYFIDFLCRAEKLVIEVDGFSHDARQELDEARTRWLEHHGYHVLRFTNNDVLNRLEGVLSTIAATLRSK